MARLQRQAAGRIVFRKRACGSIHARLSNWYILLEGLRASLRFPLAMVELVRASARFGFARSGTFNVVCVCVCVC